MSSILEKKVDQILDELKNHTRRMDKFDARMDKDDATVDKILVEVLNNKDHIKTLTAQVKNMDQKMDEVITTVDSFAKKVEKVEEEQTSNLAAHDRFEERITTLETQRAKA